MSKAREPLYSLNYWQKQATDAQEHIQSLQVKLRELLMVLEEVEWIEHDPDPYPSYHACPVCNRHRDASRYYVEKGGHASDCILHKAIKAKGRG